MAKKIIAWLLVVVLTAGIAIGGTLAYLTDRDSEANVFTAGDVNITLKEEFEQNSLLKPGVDINKDVQIKNEGPNAAYVWYTYAVPQGMEDGLILTFDNESYWTNEATAIGTKEVGGVTYNVYACKYNSVVGVGETTPIGLTKVTMNPAVDITPEGDLYLVKQGVPTNLNWNIKETENPVIFINAFAIQSQGFGDVNAAYAAFAGQWGDMIAAGTYEATPTVTPVDPRAEFNGVIYDSLPDAIANANANGGGTVKMLGSYVITEPLNIASNINLDGDGNYLLREDNTGSRTLPYTGVMINVAAGCTLSLENVVMDGGAVWTGAVDETLLRGTTNSGIVASDALIKTAGNGNVVLNEGAVLQNNDGAVAVNLGTRIGATLTMNGGWILNNSSNCGAIWGGGHITVNEGSKINKNSSTGIAGAIRMVSNCNLTMNGGEICNNTAATTGGAIYGYGASTYNFNGGKMSGNKAATGGAIYTGDSSVINISGDFKMCNNTADDAGAIRLTNYTSFNMSGGELSGNISKNTPNWDGFYGYNSAVNISGGKLAEDVTIQGGLTPVVGGDGITGVIHFALATNHNTACLAANFGSFKFTVAEGGNFAAFNLKPASGYTYTAGDENKLICLNEGYSTYWDAATSTFKIKTN